MGTALLRELQNTKVLAGSTLHITEKGNKSGGGGTSIINSLGNALLHLTTYAELWMRNHPGKPLPDYEQLTNDVSIVTYGDDVVMTVSDEATTWYRPTEHADVIKKRGCNITAPDKGPVHENYDDISDIEFLKHSTTCTLDGNITCQQSLQTAHRMLRWDRKGTESNVSVKKAKIADALDIAHAHGSSEHNELATTVYQACAAKDRSILNAGFPWVPDLHWEENLVDLQKKTKDGWWTVHYHNLTSRLQAGVPEMVWWQEW